MLSCQVRRPSLPVAAPAADPAANGGDGLPFWQSGLICRSGQQVRDLSVIGCIAFVRQVGQAGSGLE